jgi:hypothetical protein
MASVVAGSIVISSDTALLVALALGVGALAFLVLRGTARAFGVITHSESTTTSELSKEAAAALADSEKRIMELLESQLPDYASRYVARRSEADDSSLAQAIDIALQVAPAEGSPNAEIALALADLQTQIQKAHASLGELEKRTTDNCDQIDTLSSRALTPERVTVIASGMAVGLVLLLCTFGALLVAVLDVSSGQTDASNQPQVLREDMPIEAAPNYCITPVPGGMKVVRREAGNNCGPHN